MKRAGLAFQDTNGGIVSTGVYEDDPRWPAIAAILLAQNDCHCDHPERTETELLELACASSPIFTEAERAAAPWLSLSASWTNGYPQPELDWPEGPTLDRSEFCPTCGVGKRQIAPYRMSRAPKWGRRWLAGLFWEHDALFVRRDVYEEIFAPLGVPGREAVLHRGGSPIPDAIQLAPDEIVPLETTGHQATVCQACGRAKYEHPRRDFFPAPVARPDAHVVLSREWFGSGGAASRAVLVSGELYGRLKELENRQVGWHPTSAKPELSSR